MYVCVILTIVLMKMFVVRQYFEQCYCECLFHSDHRLSCPSLVSGYSVPHYISSTLCQKSLSVSLYLYHLLATVSPTVTIVFPVHSLISPTLRLQSYPLCPTCLALVSPILSVPHLIYSLSHPLSPAVWLWSLLPSWLLSLSVPNLIYSLSHPLSPTVWLWSLLPSWLLSLPFSLSHT